MNRIRPKQPRFPAEPESYKHLCQKVLRRDSWRCQTSAPRRAPRFIINNIAASRETTQRGT
jgi:hypothetical protein